MKKRLHIFYSGRVQGVGFRIAVERIASEIGLTGWVRNLRDGRVELLCEGEEEEMKRLVESVSQKMSAHITQADEDWSIASGEFKDFGIKFL